MAKIPPPSDPIAAAIDASFERADEKPRPHLGASMLGHHCDRWLWLSFRWAVRERFSGRMLRLFRRGHSEEATVIADLERIGCVMRPTDGRQDRVSFGCHVSGSMDGTIESGVPGAEKTPHLLEIKTHSKKSFDELAAKGVEKSKPMHYAQMQVYMRGAGLKRALYAAVCKDDDRYHFERVKLDEAEADRLIERGKRIALSDRMPEPCPGGSPDWYRCRFCPAHSFCWGDQTAKKVNCRTCAHATPTEQSTWHCARHDADGIPTEFQRGGCGDHVLHPDLVPWRLAGSDGQHIAVYEIGGRMVKNGTQRHDADDPVYTSAEILAAPQACADSDFALIRSVFNATIIEDSAINSSVEPDDAP
jgi:hypothetical protein